MQATSTYYGTVATTWIIMLVALVAVGVAACISELNVIRNAKPIPVS